MNEESQHSDLPAAESSADALQQISARDAAEVRLDETSYDQFPYPSHPFPQTHPDRLAMVGRLFGIEVPEPATGRILELGCGSGGNLIPLATQLPQAQLLGIDLSRKQIELGRERIERLQLSNIELRHADISAAREALEEYDYILCHGVFSWVPATVQEAILEICRDHLTPRGIAFISYNTYPGWHLRGLVRDMMCYHDNESLTPPQRVSEARALLAFLSESVAAESSAYGMLLRNELELLSRHDDGYLFHEHLEANNEPCYFHQFMEQATAKQLQYLGDASISSMWIGNFPQKVAATLQRIAPDIIQREQYTDFVRNRLFRQTLLCHQNVTIDRALSPPRVLSGRFAGRFAVKGEQTNVELPANVEVTFQVPGTSRELNTRDPLLKAAVVHLTNAWPASIDFHELFQKARLSLGANQIEDAARVNAAREQLAAALLRLFVSGMLEFKHAEDRFVTQLSDHPQTSPLVRDEARHAQRLTNQRHESIPVDDFVRHIAPVLDGSRDRETLVAYARELVSQGTLVIHSEQQQEESQLQALLTQAVDQALLKMARQALLIA